MEKHQIPIQHFDFDYVAKANDPNELEKIIEVLLSGEEGYYPDLLKAAERRLAEIKPGSKILRRTTAVKEKLDLKTEELDSITADLQNWIVKVSANSSELTRRRGDVNTCDVEIRQNRRPPLELPNKTNPKRIQSTDYRAWDKYDPDTEITKIDLEEERVKSSFALEKSQTKPKKTVSFNEFDSKAEAHFISDRELEKGREYFKSGDYEEALQCFTGSVYAKPNVTNLNNRALTYVKLKKFAEAHDDCKKVLVLDPQNLKAQLRMAQALEGMEKYEEALDCVNCVIERDPNNTTAQELANRVRRFCRNVLKNTRIKIVELN